MFKKKVYLDYAAATPVSLRVFLRMLPWFFWNYANPSALHTGGVSARRAIERARLSVAALLGAPKESIIFTSGGTESNALAIHGVCGAYRKKKHGKPLHIITTKMEHASVLRAIEKEESIGAEVTYVAPNNEGQISASEIISLIRAETVLVSIGYANNEIGSILPIAEIGKGILRLRKMHADWPVVFHTDACQAVIYCPMLVEHLHVDLLTLNGGKIGGPKGIGALYCRHGVYLESLLTGGGQEGGARAGTENVPAIVGFGVASEILAKYKDSVCEKMRGLQKFAWKKISDVLPDSTLFGPQIGSDRLPNTLFFRIPNIEAETLLLYLSENGIYCSAGSACSSESAEASHVLRAIGVSNKDARECLRWSWGKDTTRKDIHSAFCILIKMIQLLKKEPPSL